MKKVLLCCLLLIGSRYTYAQQIPPNELYQILRFWRMDSPNFVTQTYEYIQTIDRAWQLRLEPQKENGGLMILLGYGKDKVWYKDEQHRLLLSFEPNASASKGLIYTFTDLESWKLYNQRLQSMEPRLVKTTKLDGGTQTQYRVSDIYISMDEFPPGMSGVERQYRITLMGVNRSQ